MATAPGYWAKNKYNNNNNNKRRSIFYSWNYELVEVGALILFLYLYCGVSRIKDMDMRLRCNFFI